MYKQVLDKYSNVWTNIKALGIKETSELMYELYNNLEEITIFSSEASIEEKKEETLDRFAYLGIFMSDSGAIDVLKEKNEEFYSFLNQQFYDNPFLPSSWLYEKLYCVDNSKSYVELKAETLDCENKIAKMCLVQMENIIQTEIPQEHQGDKREYLRDRRMQYYGKLLDKLRASNINKDETLRKKYSDLYNLDGSFDINKFLQASEQMQPEEMETQYGALIEHIINTNSELQNKTQNFEQQNIYLSVSTLGKIAVAKRLSEKLYEYKISDLKDIIAEYDLIAGTKEEDKILITSWQDKHTKSEQMNSVMEIFLAGYTQQIRVHIPNIIFKQLEEKYGEFPTYPIKPTIIEQEQSHKGEQQTKTRSMLTRKLLPTELARIQNINIKDTYGTVKHYIKTFKQTQNIPVCRKRIQAQYRREQQDIKYKIKIVENELASQKLESGRVAVINKNIAVAIRLEEKLQRLTERLNALVQLQKRNNTKELVKGGYNG